MLSSVKVKSAHQNNYTMEAYLTHARIKKRLNSLAKLRISDRQLHIQTGMQTRPKTTQNLRTCKKFSEYVDHEAHFLLQYREDVKTDLVHRIVIDFPKVSDITDKNIFISPS